MPIQHTVEQGDGLSRIANQYGFFWQTLWSHPDNAALRKLRANPEFLLPGDVVHIPDKRLEPRTGNTDLRHRYKLNGVPARFSVRLLDDEDRPRADLPYALEVESYRTLSGRTDGGGWVRCYLPPDARRGRLVLRGGNEAYDIDFGYIDPLDTVSGAQAVLTNLGYYRGRADGELDSATTIAIREFQSVCGLPPSGSLDAATVSALKSAYLA
jgi:N-acetylmuramoyl-L-alanine amidase